MNKPKKKTIQYLNYSECMKYLEKKYDFNSRDYAGRHKNWEKSLKETVAKLGGNYADMEEDLANADKNDPEVKRKLAFREIVYKNHSNEVPYLDFWHWLIDAQGVHNGGTIYFNAEDLNVEEEWVKTIIGYILDEFGEGEDKECTFKVEW